jgi:hypothetical protein
MKTIDLGVTVPSLSEILSLAGHENLVLRTKEGREFVLAELDDFEQEIELMRKNDALMDLLHERSKDKTGHSLDQARQLLDAEDNGH